MFVGEWEGRERERASSSFCPAEALLSSLSVLVGHHCCRLVGANGRGGEGFVVILSCGGIVVVVVVHPRPHGVGEWEGRKRGRVSLPSSGGGITVVVVVVVVVVGPQAPDDGATMCLHRMVSSSLRNK